MLHSRIALAIALAFLSGCSGTSRDATGRWLAILTLDSVGALRRPSPPVRSVTGSVVLGRDNSGSYDIQLETMLGFTQLDHVSWGPRGSDSLYLRLGTGGADDGTLDLRGAVVTPDSITGEWFESRDCCGARGRFVLVRP